MGKSQRVKGSSYELKIAKTLTKWANDPTISFSRTPNSGAWASTHHNNDVVAADIVAPSTADFPFSIELKHHETVGLETAFFSNKEMPQFWEQCIGDALRANLIPMLIMHRNRSADWVVVPHSEEFLKPFKKAHKNWLSTEIVINNKVLDDTFYFDVDIIDLKELQEVYSYQTFSKTARSLFSDWLEGTKDITNLASFK